MKNKKVNILFIGMMMCLMFIGVKDVYAKDPHCAYKDPNGLEFYVYVYHNSKHTLGVKGLTTGNDVNLENIFIRENGMIYCPKTVFFKHDGGMSLSYSVHPKEYLKKEEGSTKSTLLYSAGDSSIIEYEPKISVDEFGKEQIEVCTLGGQERMDKDITLFKTAQKNLTDNYSEQKLKALTVEQLNNLKKQLENNYKDKLNKNLVAKVANQFTSYCFGANPESQLYNDKLTSWRTEWQNDLNKYNETMTLIAKLLLEKGQITQEDYDNDVITREDQVSGVIATFEAEFSKVPFSDRVFSCEGLIADELEAVLQWILKGVRIAAPILVIVLASLDFGQAVMSNDKEALNKATSKVVKRAIAALALFLVPLFVSVAIDWVDDSNPNMNCSEVIQ